LRTQVYGGQTPITHSLHTLVCLTNDIIYTKVLKNPEVNILIIGNHLLNPFTEYDIYVQILDNVFLKL